MIFEECGVELLQAEYQLGFVFLLRLPLHTSLVGLNTLCLQF